MTVLLLGVFAQLSAVPIALAQLPPSRAESASVANGAVANEASYRELTTYPESAESRDLWLSLRVRQSVLSDRALSSSAHRVRIGSVDGTVTLTGIVRTEHDKRRIASKARRLAGSDHVVDNLKISHKTE